MAVVQVNSNTLDFIFDSNTNLYTKTDTIYNLLSLNENTEIYYYNENDTLVNLNYTHENNAPLSFDATEIPLVDTTKIVAFNAHNVQFIKFDLDYNEPGLTIEKNQWYVVLDNYNYIKTKGLRVVNFQYYDNENLNTINTLVNPYIGTKTSFAKTYTLRVNGKLLNTINGKKIRNLIYNGTTYEIAEPVASGYTLTMNIVSGNNFYLRDIAYATNGGGEYTSLSSNQAGTTITLNNVVSITFKDDFISGGFLPDIDSGVKIGSTSGGTEYGSIRLNSGNTITIDLTQDTTIYVEGATIGKPIPDIPMP